MRTPLNLDDEALAAAMAHAEGRTKTEVINEALRQFARAKRLRGLLDLRSKVPWEGDTDSLRKRTDPPRIVRPHPRTPSYPVGRS